MTDDNQQTEVEPELVIDPLSGQFVPAKPEPEPDAIESAIGRGGDVIFTPGQGNPAGDFIFKLANGSESLRLCANGDVFINGSQLVRSELETYQLVRSELETYYAFKAWLRGAIKTANGVD